MRGAVLLADLGGEHPGIAIFRNELSDHAFGGAAVVGVGGVDEIDFRFARGPDHMSSRRLVHAGAKVHRAETEARDAEPAPAESAVVHVMTFRA